MRNLLLVFGLILSGFITTYGQTIIVVSADQSAMLHADAGDDTGILSGEAVVIGGAPSATGGTEPYSYSWNDGTGIISSDANPSVNPAENTIYTLVVTDNNTCTAVDTVIISVSISGISDFTDKELRIYPNPASDLINIDITGDECMISLTDENGIKLWSKPACGKTTLTVPRAPGVYFLKVTGRDKQSIRKIVVTR